MSNKLNKSFVSNRTLSFLALVKLCLLIYLQSPAAAYSTSFDFGPVALGTTSTTIVTIFNQEGEPLVVTGMGFLTDGCPDFRVASPTGSMWISEGESLEIQVNYSPSETGECSNELRIWLGSPVASIVALSGSGVVIQSNLEDKIQEILTFLDNHVRGKGAGKSAENRLNALRNMIEVAAVHIKKGQTDAAWQKLSGVYKKVEDFSKPADFIDEGLTKSTDAIETLARMIQDLMTQLEKDAIKTESRIDFQKTL